MNLETKEAPPLPGVQLAVVRSRAEHAAYLERTISIRAERDEFEIAFADPDAESWTMDGTCFVCDREVEFHMDWQNSREEDGRRFPDWRQGMVCPGCGLDGRYRAAVHFFDQMLLPATGARICLAEPTPRLLEAIAGRYTRLTGGNSLQALDAGDGCLDFVLAFDAPDTGGVRECRRVVAPGGAVLLCLPESLDCGDHGAWDLVSEVAERGFTTALALMWSAEYGYLGNHTFVLGEPKRKALQGAPGSAGVPPAP